ncbi:amidohydrolase family protein [Actinomadura sp. HBU206391]|uniref:amidohydrolase family protein n=1 Tax=Actinomadura sp. HBU206391 TaxID=2731692 RepID=UPI00164F04E2|nr:amidohydrolase [Actinomadura sp. HBU206391]MBC6459616.1 amidohydrolase [Actinomadura sp. HBU206391]
MSGAERADLVVTGGDVLTVDEAGTVVGDGAVAVRDGVIAAVGPAADIAARYASAEVLDAGGCLVLPGLINAHTHLAMAVFRGRADDVDLQGFLAEVIAAEVALLSPEMVAAGVECAVAESVRSGVTAALDMYWFHETAADVAARTGFRLLTGPTFMDIDGPPDGLDFAARLEWAGADLAGGRPYVMAHSTYTLDPGQLREVAALARKHDAVLHIHAAENAGEVDMVAARYGRRPVELLDDLGLLGPGTVLAHAVHLTDAEIDALARTGTAIAHCPVSNLKLAAGVARVPDLLAAGVPVGLGTDGAVSSNTLDMFTALRTAAIVHKGFSGDPTVVDARQAVQMATIGSARAVGMGDRLGSLEVGKQADLIVVDLNAPHLLPRHDPWSTLAYAATAADVRDTVVAGRILMRDRHLTTLDESELATRLQRVTTA